MARSLTGWKTKGAAGKSKWAVGTAVLDAKDAREVAIAKEGSRTSSNTSGAGADGYSEARFGDCVIEIEVMVPKGSNSGINVMGEYEVQVLDSFGPREQGRAGDMGGLDVDGPRGQRLQEAGRMRIYSFVH